MLLDEIFEKELPKEIVISRKNGQIQFASKSIHQEHINHINKPLFPINKDRK